jgi:hypothetical protein
MFFVIANTRQRTPMRKSENSNYIYQGMNYNMPFIAMEMKIIENISMRSGHMPLLGNDPFEPMLNGFNQTIIITRSPPFGGPQGTETQESPDARKEP